MFIEKIKAFRNFLLDLIFPKECLSCGKEGLYLCSECLKKIELNKKFYCTFCKKESDLSKVCPSCQGQTVLKAVWLASDYNNELLQRLIHNLKYNYIEELAEILSRLIINYLEENKIFQNLNFKNEEIIFAPVPLHKKRLLQRGFNQSYLLAEKLSNYYKIPIINLLSRSKNTESQVNLKRSDRQENIRNAFIFNNEFESLKNKKIILVDDVVTTGSTLRECADILSNNGFFEIYGLVIAQRED